MQTRQEREEAQAHHDAISSGLKLDTLQVRTRKRVIKLAEKMGWNDDIWFRRSQCEIWAKALLRTRETLQTEGISEGLPEVDLLWHEFRARLDS